MQEEEEQFGPLLVGTLEQHGIAATDVKKLMVGFHICYCGRETDMLLWEGNRTVSDE